MNDFSEESSEFEIHMPVGTDSLPVHDPAPTTSGSVPASAQHAPAGSSGSGNSAGPSGSAPLIGSADFTATVISSDRLSGTTGFEPAALSGIAGRSQSSMRPPAGTRVPTRAWGDRYQPPPIPASVIKRKREQAQTIYDAEYTSMWVHSLTDSLLKLDLEAEEQATDMSIWWFTKQKVGEPGSWHPHTQTRHKHSMEVREFVEPVLEQVLNDALANEQLDVNAIRSEYILERTRAEAEEAAWRAAELERGRVWQEEQQRVLELEAGEIAAPSNLSSSSTANPPGLPSSPTQMVRLQPVQRAVTWDGFTHESTKRFRDYCAQQQRFPETWAAFEPARFIQDDLLRQLPNWLESYKELHPYRRNSPKIGIASFPV